MNRMKERRDFGFVLVMQSCLCLEMFVHVVTEYISK